MGGRLQFLCQNFLCVLTMAPSEHADASLPTGPKRHPTDPKPVHTCIPKKLHTSVISFINNRKERTAAKYL